jgi:hypothetical protein
VFDGGQGDLFINVLTQNFSGDINVYQASDLKPLTQMVMFAENGVSETGRVIYMRQPGRLLLRVQGRTPNDDPASYRIKFAGSFVALAPQKLPEPPSVGSTDKTGIKVNAVGTIIGGTPTETSSEKNVGSPSIKAEKASPEKQTAGETAKTEATLPPQDRGRESASGDVPTVFGNRSHRSTAAKKPPEKDNPPNRRTTPPSSASRRKAEPPVDPLAGASLVIVLKDGTRIERPMSDVTRFVIDHGALTVFAKDGSIHRIAAADVASVTVQ